MQRQTGLPKNISSVPGRCFALALFLCLAGASHAQSVSVYQEDNKLIRAPRSIARLGDDAFGDKVSLYTGSLEFVQTDLSIPGNNALPVSVGRRLQTGRYSANVGAFGNWDLEIPHLHGMFAQSAGWQTFLGTDRNARCSAFGPPSTAPGTYGAGSAWAASEFWQGNFLYVPGAGDQELLTRNAAYTSAPAGNAALYPLVTRNNWSIRCLPSTDPRNGAPGEAFIAVSPDGTQYRFDWLVARPQGNLEKGSPQSSNQSVATGARGMPEAQSSTVAGPAAVDAAAASPQRGGEVANLGAGTYALARSEVWLLPTSVTDR